MITIKKSIEILELNIKEAGKRMPPDCKDAIQLGIEAMKEIERWRGYFPDMASMCLPGEADEHPF